MSEYLGFKPSENPFYYFLSYNSEDKEAVGNLALTMMYSGINLWYDYGINYGDGWEETIAEKINNSQGVILFFTKGILHKKESYVQREYKIAKFLKCKVYVIFVEKIEDEDIPIEKVPWWLDISEKQNVNLFDSDILKVIEQLSKILGIQTHEDKMSQMIGAYNKLYFEGKVAEADLLLNEYLRSISLKGKVEILANIINGGFVGTALLSYGTSFSRNDSSTDEPLLTHMGKPIQDFYEGKKIAVNDDIFIIGNDNMFHRGSRGDAHVIWIWKNGTLIHTIGGLIDAYKLNVYLDTIDNILYVSYLSDYEPFMIKSIGVQGGPEIKESLICITTIENPNDMPICTDFRFIDIQK